MSDIFQKAARGSLLGPPKQAPKRTDLSGLAAAAANAMHAQDDASWRQFCDQALRDLRANVDDATMLKLAASAEKLRGGAKRDARVEFAKQVIALAAGDASVALAPVDAFEALEQRKREIFERIDRHERECLQTETEMRKLVLQTPKPTAQLVVLRTKLDALKSQIDGFKKDLAGLDTLAQRTIDTANDVRDIGITVGYLAYPATTGPVPVYAVIVVDFPDAKGFKADLLDRLELSVDADRRYKLYLPGEETSPFAETDDPVDVESDKTFQRLAKHWGYWFLRVQGNLNQWDFQIIGNKVFPLKHPIEASLAIIEGTREAAREAALDGSQHDRLSVIAEAEWICDRFEALVGKMPVKRRGLKREPGIVHARVVQKNLKDMNANAQWVRLDENKLETQLKKVIGGPFVSIVWENVRTGVDLMQLMPKTTEQQHGPDIWLRAKRGRRQPIVGHAQRIQMAGQDLPLEEFNPENVESLREEDVRSVRGFYQTTSARLREAKAARVEASADESTSEVDKPTHEAIVQNYLRLCQIIRISASGNDPNAQKVWPYLRDAVIFELPSAAYLTLYEEFFRYCVRSAKVDPDIPLKQHTDKQRKRVMDVIGTGMDAPFPEKMPFQSCFFAYGRGMRDPNGELLEDELRKREANAPADVGKLYGHLVTATGMVVGFRHLEDPARDGIVFTFDRDPTSSKGQRWDRPHSLSPWIINALVSYVNEHKTLVEAGKNGLGHQMLVKKTAKGLSMKPPIPPPFYVVYLKDEFVREQARQRASSIKRHIDWQHRWKVRGHDCLKYMRGSLPLDSELEKELLARRYKIYTVEQPDSETFMALAKRGVAPKGTDEWLAVLSYWRDSFEKGPPEKPMIESVRRSTKKWAEDEPS